MKFEGRIVSASILVEEHVEEGLCLRGLEHIGKTDGGKPRCLLLEEAFQECLLLGMRGRSQMVEAAGGVQLADLRAILLATALGIERRNALFHRCPEWTAGRRNSGCGYAEGLKTGAVPRATRAAHASG